LTWNVISTQPNLWLEASQVTASGGSVSTWADARGSGISVGNSAGVGATSPTVSAGSLNGHDVITFNGTSDALFTDSAPASSLFSDTASTTFIVQNLPSSGGSPASFAWVADNPGGGHQAVAINADSTTIGYTHGSLGAPDEITAPSPSPSSGFHVLALQRSGTSGSISVDGSSLTISGGFNSGVQVSTGTTPRLTIGAAAFPGGNAGGFYTGGIAEIIVFSTALSSTDMTTVENYLGNKYGISAVPEPSQYATFFGLACIVGALVVRARRRQQIA
jgi:hypothetical protein